ncbi:MAG: hypothetical protein QXK88_01565 [Desulfurococcaceae archaeon]
MPVPLIYSNFRGRLKPVEPVTVERLMPPDWLGLTPQQLGWVETLRGGKEVYVNVGVEDDKVVMDLDVRGYHLERTSIRGVNPNKWTNWAMLYVSVEYLNELIASLRGFLPSRYGLLVPGGFLSGGGRSSREVRKSRTTLRFL